MDILPQPDRETIERAVGVLFADEELVELRVIGPHGTERGYYDDFDKLAHDAALASEPKENRFPVSCQETYETNNIVVGCQQCYEPPEKASEAPVSANCPELAQPPENGQSGSETNIPGTCKECCEPPEKSRETKKGRDNCQHLLDTATKSREVAAKQPGTNVYVILNRIKPEFAPRVQNTITHGSATKDHEIERRRWLLIDLDPARPAGTSATESEKAATVERARAVQRWLSGAGWPAPVVADSGNGVHLYYALDLENTEEVSAAVNGVLRVLDCHFTDGAVKIDQSVGNPSRISKLPGTVARKGTSTEDRPHRTSKLLFVPEYPEAVSLLHLQAVAGSVEEPTPSPSPPVPDPIPGDQGDPFNIPELLARHGIKYNHQPGYQTAQGPADLYQLNACPWAAAHTSGPGGAAVMQFPSGAVSFTCRHEHCQNRRWEDFRQHLGIGTGPSVDDLQFPPKPEDDMPDLRLDLPRPELAQAAYHGTLGEIAQLAGEHSEADPAAVLMQALTGFGVVAGRSAYFTVAGGTHHYPKLFLAICGRTSKARKGLSLDIAVRFLAEADDAFHGLMRGGLTTGEGLISSVRDPAYGLDKKGNPVLTCAGVEDKRGLFVESEMAVIFERLRREGNTLSQVLRDAWDDKTLAVATRKDPMTATDSHLSLIAHITGEELRETLRPSDINNGLANRFIWCFADRWQLLPRGGDLPAKYVTPLVEDLRAAVAYAQTPQEIGMSESAWQLWDGLYHELDAEQEDLIMEGLSSRAAPQIRRMALLFALADRQGQVHEPHLQAARACFEYSRATLQHVYVSGIDSEEARAVLAQILARLKVGPATRTDLYNLFQRHVPSPKIRSVLTAAELKGLVICTRDETGGRPVDLFSTP